ncbi:cytosolic sulfotransferase 17-like [Pistacia vera]|uniref:cytosolic sulfotransferase 17-like n=1 Tax=Pistacia vera TaxID=55513 RepID=UPI001263D0CB|nr:cytosolic sulfotransferase 17-like [Pistacia vera]XP_031275920.1 cytosolic sulfotransferase 17-like [Pistacia vera]
MFAQENFKPQPDDIFLCSAMKTGTTWLKALAFATVTRTLNSSNPLLCKNPHDCIPFLEKDYIKNPIIQNTKPRVPLWSTHVLYSSLPKSVINSDCKIVYICRDPKDSFVSLWHFTNKLSSQYNIGKISLQEAFELYCNGCSVYGPYWDHVLSYWKASQEWPNRVLFLKYEEMMKDARFYLKKLADFMGFSFSLEEEREGAVDKILEFCSFENLSNLEVNKMGKHRPDEKGGFDNNMYFRKGEIGDWKNTLTLEMGARLDKIMEDKLRGSGLIFNSSLD